MQMSQPPGAHRPSAWAPTGASHALQSGDFHQGFSATSGPQRGFGQQNQSLAAQHSSAWSSSPSPLGGSVGMQSGEFQSGLSAAAGQPSAARQQSRSRSPVSQRTTAWAPPTGSSSGTSGAWQQRDSPQSSGSQSSRSGSGTQPTASQADQTSPMDVLMRPFECSCMKRFESQDAMQAHQVDSPVVSGLL